MARTSSHVSRSTLFIGIELSTPADQIGPRSSPMFTLFKPDAKRIAVELAYRRIVEQARQPGFFLYCGVPDTIDGRFELICLHAFLYLHRLKDEQPRSARHGRRFVAAMFADFDRSLREMGTGDLSVGREVKRMAQALYGGMQAYKRGRAGGGTDL